MARIGQLLTALPHTSCSVERLFSQLKLIKTPLRNSLKDETLESILVLKPAHSYIDLNNTNIVRQLVALEAEMNKIRYIDNIESKKRKLDQISNLKDFKIDSDVSSNDHCDDPTTKKVCITVDQQKGDIAKQINMEIELFEPNNKKDLATQEESKME